MILSINTGGTWRRNVNYSEIEVIKDLALSGFRAFDFSFYDMTEDSPFMSADWKDEAKRIADFAAENNYSLSQAHIPAGNPLMPEDEKSCAAVLSALSSARK